MNNFINTEKNVSRDKKYNILVYNLGYPRYSGGVYYVDGLACSLAELGHNVTMIMNGPNISSFNLNYSNLRRVINQKFVPPKSNYDYIFSIHQIPMTLASEYAKKHNIPFIPIVFELPNWIRKYIPNWTLSKDHHWTYMKSSLKNSTKILCLANECIHYIREFVPETISRPIYVIEGIINDRIADEALKYNKTSVNKNTVCWIGYSAIHKDVKDLINAIKMLDNYKEWTINYITPIIDKSSEVLAKKLGVNLNMIVGADDLTKFRIINSSRIIVSTSKFEGGICISILEGLYYKKPIISYDLPIHKECCKDIISYVPMGDIKKLSEKIDSVQDSPQIELDLRYKFVKNNFTINSVGKRLQHIIDIGDIK